MAGYYIINASWCWLAIIVACMYIIGLGATDVLVVPGIQISLRSSRVKRETLTTCDDKKPPRQCAPDCKTLLFCDSTTVLGRFSCPSTNPDCDLVLNTCVAKRPADQCPASQLKADSSCPAAEGYFPDPRSCRLYNYCEKSKVVISYTCPALYAFDMLLSQCRRGAPCGTINCIGKTVGLHSTYPSLYAFCNNNAIVEGSYSKCAIATEEFDLNEFKCKAKCKTEGNIAHETDCKKFYRCLATGPWGTLEKTEQSCPPGQTFNVAKLICDKTVTVCP